MKIGTDSVLLGSWTSIETRPQSILDIGAGTGVLALMMAQRTSAQLIDALEIDDDAYEQCTENFENSPWSDRLFCYHASLNDFAAALDERYDLIICNPPFYSEDYKSSNRQRDLARFQDAMPFEDLLQGVSTLLQPNGLFSVVIPYSEEDRLMRLATSVRLHPQRKLLVRGNHHSKIKRSLIEFSFEHTQTNIDQLTIESDRHVYTDAYIGLTKDFYIHM